MNPAHLDYDVLADLAEGLLDDDHAASASAHLDECAQCRARSAEVADVSGILADIPVPPMPAELATRIDEAIRAASMDTVTVASLEHRRGRRHLRIFSVAAASVIAIGGGAIVGTALLSDSASNDGGSGYEAHSRPPADNPGGPGGSGDGGGASVRKPGTSAESAQEPQLKQQAVGYPSLASGTRYRSQELASQVPVVVRQAGDQKVRLPTAATGCVENVRQGLVPVLVDQATYDGQPATVIVLPAGGAMWRVVVVAMDCAPLGQISLPAKTP